MKQKRSRLGCLFWVGLILLILVVVVFNKPKIDQVLKTTGFTQLLTNRSPSAQNPIVTRVAPGGQSNGPRVTVKAPSATSGTQAPPEKPAAPQAPSSQTGSPSKPVAVTPSANQPPAPSSTTSSTPSSSGSSGSKSSQTQSSSQPSTLYFVRLDASGTPTLVTVTRDIAFHDAPLTETIDALLSGTSTTDKNQGLLSLIPDGTKLIDARVADGTAYLNFNDRFRFNSFGQQGYDYELRQVVFTATQFPTVKRVQLLIDGTVRQYLGPESVQIDKPLERSSLSES